MLLLATSGALCIPANLCGVQARSLQKAVRIHVAVSSVHYSSSLRDAADGRDIRDSG